MLAGTLDRVVTYVATQLMLATACTAAEVSESGRSVSFRSFTKVHAVSELTLWVSRKPQRKYGVSQG